MACFGIFQSCREQNVPNPKSGWDRDPDKLTCVTCTQEDMTNPSFSHSFLLFSSLIP